MAAAEAAHHMSTWGRRCHWRWAGPASTSRDRGRPPHASHCNKTRASDDQRKGRLSHEPTVTCEGVDELEARNNEGGGGTATHTATHTATPILRLDSQFHSGSKGSNSTTFVRPHPATWPLLGGASRPAVTLPRVPQQTPAPCDSTVSAHKQHAKSTNYGMHPLAPRHGKSAAGATHKNPHTSQCIRAEAQMATALHPTAQGSRLPRYPLRPLPHLAPL